MSVKNTILENLVTAFKGIKQSAGCNHTAQTVQRSTVPFDTIQQKKPAIAILEGSEEIQVEGPTNLRNQTQLFIEATIDKDADLEQEVTELGDDIRKISYSPPSLGDNALDFYLTGQESLYLEQSVNDAVIVMGANLIWYDAKSTADSTGTDIYGTPDVFKTCKDAIVGHLNNLVTTMSNDSYAPALNYVYDSHAKAALKLNAISVELGDAARGDTGSQSAAELAHWLMQFILRIHVNYAGRYLNPTLVENLFNSVESKLNENYILASGYRLKDFTIDSVREEFSESATVGGQATIKVFHSQRYEQV
ncbi:MAG: hypothetical protein PVJ60_00605 [Phycisphaerales bacterium]|jgi:hypothetical protein